MNNQNPGDFFSSLKRVPVLDSEMAYFEAGTGFPVVFLHGNPTSSYMWRNIFPYIHALARCLAPDLIGMGRSSPSPRKAYRLLDHSEYLDDWFGVLNIGDPLVLVMQDWGVPLGLYYARRHPNRIAGIAYMEGQVLPRSWSDLPGGRDKIFRALRGRDGERMALEENFVLEKMFFGSLMAPMSEEDKNVYRAFLPEAGESRLPLLMWPREIVFDGQPPDNEAIIRENGAWLSTSTVPKLFINAEPGNSIAGEAREFCRQFSNQTEVTVSGNHYLPEESPAEIGEALAEFVEQIIVERSTKLS